jgi:23S rRNA pseudouridine1911/1915/1917 synthase
VYEDEDLIVIDKPPGLVVHPTRGYPDGTLANGLMYYWRQQGKSYRFHPVTRLDKDTSGLMVIAKHAYAHAFLAQQMEKKRYERIYLAIAEGIINPDKGSISLPIGFHPENPFARAVVHGEGGAKAVTHYEVLEHYSSASLVRLRLETGRTHQIRVHLSAIGHPLIGDSLYGKESPWISRQALHATYLRFFHPRMRIWLEWESPLPEDMRQVIARLKGEG